MRSSDSVVPDTADVVVVGGGPAGLHGAARLAAEGYAVHLFEEHGVVGEPVHCTGVLAREAFETFGVPRGSILNDLTTVRFHAPSGHTIEYSPAEIEAVVIDRVCFDQQLAQQAADCGVVIRTARATKIDIDATGVTVVAGAASVRARACVLACGASYALHRRLDLGRPKLVLQSAQAELPADRLGPVEVHFGTDVAPRGFAWAVPVQRRDRQAVRIGVMCASDARKHFRWMVDKVSSRWGIRDCASCVPRHKVLPLGPILRTTRDRLVAVGDAGGLVKPTTGGGIYYSLLSAQLAADVLIPALREDVLNAARLEAYERAWRAQIGSELRWQTLLRRIAQRLSDADIDRLFDLARTDGLMPIVRRTARFNRHRDFIMALLKHPPARRVLIRAALA
jgi:geranylgeranyl reductase family protein